MNSETKLPVSLLSIPEGRDVNCGCAKDWHVVRQQVETLNGPSNANSKISKLKPEWIVDRITYRTT